MPSLMGGLLALLTAGCWAGNSVAWRYLGERSSSSFVANSRMWFALPMVFILALVIDHGLPLHSSWETYTVLLLSGAIGYFVTDMLMFRAYILLGSRESLVILTLSPVFTAALSWGLFKEALSWTQILGIVVVSSGIVMMVLSEKRSEREEGKSIKRGVIYAILGSFFQALSYVMAKYALADITAIGSNLVRNVGGFLTFLIYTALFERSFFRELSFFKNQRNLVVMLSAALAGPVVGMSSEMAAFALAPAGVVSAISQISPVMLLPVDRFAYKRRIGTLSLLGTLISIGGVGLLFL